MLRLLLRQQGVGGAIGDTDVDGFSCVGASTRNITRAIHACRVHECFSTSALPCAGPCAFRLPYGALGFTAVSAVVRRCTKSHEVRSGVSAAAVNPLESHSDATTRWSVLVGKPAERSGCFSSASARFRKALCGLKHQRPLYKRRPERA